VNIIPSPAHRDASSVTPYRTGYGNELYDILAELGVTAGKEILDVGCGRGISMEPLTIRGCVVTGLDPNADRLADARERLPNVKLVQGRAEQLPFPDRSFDGVICAHAFHHFDRAQAMKEMVRVARSGRPVATWWKVLSTTERAREAREIASLRAGRPPMPDANKAGFKEFFGTPFADRRMRVLRHVVFTTVDQWMGYERTRGRAAQHYGDRFEEYLRVLETELRSSYGDGEMQATYVQYLYVGLAA
jgi:ubiquinone/menaquinone biosynthesis C-methylase UbiE